MNQELFQQEYDRLNDAQKQAVDTIYGPVMVIAGPGSGKTQLLSLRIANILRIADSRPESILCLTFTHSAAETMRKRLMKMIGALAYRVEIHTFHSFGAELLARIRGVLIENNLDSESLVDAQIVGDLRVVALLDDLLSGLSSTSPLYGILNPPGDDRLNSIRKLKSTFGDLKKSNISSETLEAIIEDMSSGIDMVRDVSHDFVRSLDQYGVRSQSDKDARFHLFESYVRDLQTILGDAPKLVEGHESFATAWMKIVKGTIEAMTENDKLTISPLSDFIKKYLFDGKSDIFLWDKELRKTQEFLALYRHYSDMMNERGYHDFDDLLLQAHREILASPLLRQELAERYEWILIDEFQDTNDIQLSLATSFLEDIDSPNILVVGDDDQAIYKFQGASSINFERFAQKYSDTQVIILEYNYRSLAPIIEHSRSLMSDLISPIEKIFQDISKSFLSHRSGIESEEGGRVEYILAENPIDQAIFVVDSIQEYIKNSGQYCDIAILSRKNRSLQQYLGILTYANIPVQTTADEYISKNDSVLLLVDILAVIAGLAGYISQDITRSACINVLVSNLWGLDRRQIWEILSDKSLHFLAPNEFLLKVIDRSLGTPSAEFAQFLLDVASLHQSVRLDDILDMVTGAAPILFPLEQDSITVDGQIVLFGGAHKQERISPYYQRMILDIMSSSPALAADRLSNIDVFLKDLKNFVRQENVYSLSSVADYLILGKKYGWAAKSSKLFLGGQESVTLSTIHKAKGQEYKKVFMIDTTADEYRDRSQSSLLPKYILPPREPQDIDDERRLVYTAFTRAENELTILSFGQGLDERPKNQITSLANIKFDTLPSYDIARRALYLPLLRKSPDSLLVDISSDEKEFLHSRIVNLSMNATLFSAFFHIAEDGPAEFISRHILKLPGAQSEAQIYGNAFHAGLEAFVQEYEARKIYDEKRFFASAFELLDKSDLLEPRRIYYKNELTMHFPMVFEKIQATNRDQSFVEYGFGLGSGQEKVFLGDIALKGKLDRIDLSNDGTLVVHDYKSSKLSKMSLSYELQLRFYSVILSLSSRFASYPIKSFALDALHSHNGAPLISYILFPQSSEIERDKAIIAYVYERIMSLDWSIPDGIKSAKEWCECIATELGYGKSE